MKIITIVTFLFFINNLCYCQTLAFPKLPNDKINDMCFIKNNEELIFINDAGGIYKSYDGGNSWNLKQSFNNTSLKEIHFINSEIGFILPIVYPGYPEIGLIYTTDSGETWKQQDLWTYNAITILPISENILLKATDDGEIQLLNNYFNTWETKYKVPTHRVNGEYGTYEYPNGHIIKFQRLPNNNILAIGVNDNISFAYSDSSNSFILKSTDQGSSWDTLCANLTEYIYNFSMTDNQIGWLSYWNKLLKTTDGGSTWELQSFSQNTGEYISDIFSFGNNLLIALSSSYIYRTSNLGITWDNKSINLDYGSKIFIIDKIGGFIYNNNLLRTVNGFRSFSLINNSIDDDITKIDFISEYNGFALGKYKLYKTMCSGKTWVKSFEFTDAYNACDIEMVNDSLGWVVYSGGKIFKTTNRGLTWNEVNVSTQKQMYAGIEFLDKNFGILFSVSEEVSPNNFESKYHYITTDGGKTWVKNQIDSSKFGYFDKVQIISPDRIWAINIYGLWLSSDTAKTWSKIFSYDLFIGGYSFCFESKLFGAITTYDEIIITTDGGNTWVHNLKTNPFHPKDCASLGLSIQGNRIIEVGTNGKMSIYYFNSNGKYDWGYLIDSHTNNNLNAISVYNRNNFPNVWISGDGFNVYHREFELIVSGVDNDNKNLSEFTLSQNYPNPFNPTTKIRYTIPTLPTGQADLPVSSPLVKGRTKEGFVTLKVYDILGNEVATLVNEVKQPGSYEVEFPGRGGVTSPLPSGIYFYVLKAGEYRLCKKMCLIK